MQYIRFESALPNRRGVHVGIFALANDLAHTGRLTPAERHWWRTNNDWYEAAYTDPSTVDPTLFDRTVHPIVTCWFKDTADHLLTHVPGYLDLLDRHGVAWRECRSADPGTVIYEDPHQILVTPSPPPDQRTDAQLRPAKPAARSSRGTACSRLRPSSRLAG